MFCQLDNDRLTETQMTTSVEIEECLWRQSHNPSARSKLLGDKALHRTFSISAPSGPNL